MRVLAKLPPQPEMVHGEITRWLEQAATVLEVFILPTINQTPPLLDLRTGKQGNAAKVAEIVGIAGKEELGPEPSIFMPQGMMEER